MTPSTTTTANTNTTHNARGGNTNSHANGGTDGAGSISGFQSYASDDSDDDSSHSSDDSIHHRKNDKEDEQDVGMRLVQKEARVVLCYRMVVFTILGISAIVVGYCTHYIISKNDRNQFQLRYDQAVDTIFDTSTYSITNVYTIVHSLSVSISIFASQQPPARRQQSSQRQLYEQQQQQQHRFQQEEEDDLISNLLLDNYSVIHNRTTPAVAAAITAPTITPAVTTIPAKPITNTNNNIPSSSTSSSSSSSSSTSSSSSNSNSKTTPWPYYKIPDFDALASNTRNLINNNNAHRTFAAAAADDDDDKDAAASASLIAFAPMITEQERSQWNEYSTVMLQTTLTTTKLTTPILQLEEKKKHQDSFSPVWQYSIPSTVTKTTIRIVVDDDEDNDDDGDDGVEKISSNVNNHENLVNFDLQSIPFLSKLIQHTTSTGLPAIAQISFSSVDSNNNNSNNVFSWWLHVLQNQTSTKLQQQVLLVQPVFYNIDNDQQLNSVNDKFIVVGHLFTILPWSKFLDNIKLNDNDSGIYFVIQEGSCSTTFSSSNTYQMEGNNKDQSITFLGSSDLHDPKYDDYHRTTVNITAITSPIGTGSDSSDVFVISAATGGAATTSNVLQPQEQMGQIEQELDNHLNLCTYDFHVYPSDKTYHSYIAKSFAGNVTILVIMIFIFTSIIFLCYDYFIQKRQTKILTTAARSTAIVSSLFPENVRDQLFAQTENNNNNLNNQNFGSGSLDDGTSHNNSSSTLNNNGKKKRSKSSNLRQSVFGNIASAGIINNNSDRGGTGLMSNVSSEAPPKRRLNLFLNGAPTEAIPEDDNIFFQSRPIADLFPHATVMFADIAGFTAWSSVREPCQVFTLLETVYRAFDIIAKQRRVFKVETIGDCYVAVVGLPEPRKDHAVVMARFARDSKGKFNELSHKLEVTLGPDTGDLAMRFGLHSGPVTAGVLRGERARFQLFGDTVNTASRIESTGKRNRIHISQQTADLIIGAGKANWVRVREEKIVAKGKGELETYWLLEREEILNRTNSSTGSTGENSNLLGSMTGITERSVTNDDDIKNLTSSHNSTMSKMQSMRIMMDKQNEQSYRHPHSKLNPASPSGSSGKDDNANKNGSANNIFGGAGKINNAGGADASGDGPVVPAGLGNGFPIRRGTTDKVKRLIGWNCEVLLQLLRQIVARRLAIKARKQLFEPVQRLEAKIGKSDAMVLDEVVEVIKLPKFDPKFVKKQADPRMIDLGEAVESQLRSYVTAIASLYRENPFHNFEHASHVTMSTVKLLSRIVAPDVDVSVLDRDRAASELHDYTYGITSDPLTQFAVVLSALIHDVDHRGVPNFLLIKEEQELASLYKDKSVAEQNSVDIAWEALMDPEYEELRNTIYTDEFELNRFRQLIVNSVMATDIFDKELSTLRKKRWDKAFYTSETSPKKETVTSNNSEGSEDSDDGINRKATIVIEHLIQASDVAHCMQHWQVYQKWNHRLFEEMYTAYQLERSPQDPSLGWYQGELGFLDNYVIPLAKKLKNCGVFGVSSDEYLNYALENRNEWELKGKQIVEDLVKKYKIE